MAKKLYVGGLSYSTSQETLKDAFAKAGAVESATIIIDKMSGRSKGFGFVEMTSDDEALKAIDMWNGKELDGRTLTVNEARPMEPRAPRSGGFNNRGGGGGGGGGFGGGRRDNW
ncbi:MAG: RNA-binding protein [Patescibacteria group bacterium]